MSHFKDTCFDIDQVTAHPIFNVRLVVLTLTILVHR